MKKRTSLIVLIIGLFPAIALSLSSIYSLYGVLKGEIEFLKLAKCLFGLIVVAIPLWIKPKFSEMFNPSVHIVYYIFIFFSVFGGEMLGLYARFTHFDSFLHLLSGGLIAAIGYQIGESVIDRKQHPFFLALFAFCFAMTVGILWEIYEFTGDRLLDLNMQRYQGKVGWLALYDTMKDILCNTLGALIISSALSLQSKDHS